MATPDRINALRFRVADSKQNIMSAESFIEDGVMPELHAAMIPFYRSRIARAEAAIAKAERPS